MGRSNVSKSTTAVVASACLAGGIAAGYYLYSSKKTTNTAFRIVSLCPSTTLTLYDLGLADFVVGRTRYCETHPNGNKSNRIEKVGGTKDPDWEKIRDLKPTHILFNMEENDYTHLPKAQEICGKENTIVDTPVSIQESKELVLHLGRVFGEYKKAATIASAMDAALLQLKQSSNKKAFTYLYFIWHTPDQRVAGKNTYIEAMLEAAGGVNQALTISDERYPLIPEDFVTKTEVDNSKADYCLLSTEPFPFKEHHKDMYSKFGKQTRIIDGEKLSWHGSKTVEGLRYLVEFFQNDSTSS